MGTQLQLFTAASENFFIKESICTASLRQLLLIVGLIKNIFATKLL
jgi:hypothetical protein